MEYKYMTDANGWSKELVTVFFSGFVVATLLWLGLWFFQAKPTQAAVWEAQESALQICLAEKQAVTSARTKLEADNEALTRRLKDASLGWGRCLRDKNGEQAALASTEN